MADLHEVDINALDLDDSVQETTGDHDPTPPVEYRTGAAGTGKTFSVRQQIEADPKWAMLCATTGIAAVNLGTITLHSALGLHPDSIEDQFISGAIRVRMHNLARQYRNLAIDEISMLPNRLLDILYTTAEQVNEYVDVKERGNFGIVCVGDFCQLPPIADEKGAAVPWAFDAECWPKFEAATTKLTKNWRQGDGTFLDALNYLRAGNGASGSKALSGSGAHFHRALDPQFDGTVILGRNAEVDNYNLSRYWKLKGHEFVYPATRWGKESGGWKNVPEVLKVKVGAYVMILANDTAKDEFGQSMFRWVNGDCGHVRDVGDDDNPVMAVELVRTGKVVDIGYIERRTQQKHPPDDATDDEIKLAKEAPGTRLSDGTFYDAKKGFWVRGALTYMPLRLAYATTVHKSQGLTLDRIMVDLRHAFLGAPAMSYVAMSRCRTADGLHIVGDAAMIERRCKIDPRVKRWL